MKEYIARFGHGSAKLARQAQSKEKTLDKMVRGGLTEKVQGDHVVRLRFTDVGKLPPPVLQFADVTFGYSPERVLYRNVSKALPACMPVCCGCLCCKGYWTSHDFSQVCMSTGSVHSVQAAYMTYLETWHAINLLLVDQSHRRQQLKL